MEKNICDSCHHYREIYVIYSKEQIQEGSQIEWYAQEEEEGTTGLLLEKEVKLCYACFKENHAEMVDKLQQGFPGSVQWGEGASYGRLRYNWKGPLYKVKNRYNIALKILRTIAIGIVFIDIIAVLYVIFTF